MTSVSKNVYIDKSDDIVIKYSNRCHSTIKMKPVDVKSNKHVDFNEENNKEDNKFEVGDYVIILKYKNFFAKGYVQNWHGEVFMIKNYKNTVPWTYVINDLNGEEIVGWFY